MENRTGRGRPRYESRPGRTAVVVSSLTELQGPAAGIVELPLRLHWQPNRRIDLDVPSLRLWMYATVLTEAVRAEELRTWIHGPTLLRLWPDLVIPTGVRRAWEDRFPQLRLLVAR